MSKDGTAVRVNINEQQFRESVEDDKGNIWFGSFNGLWKYDVGLDQYSHINTPKYLGGLSHPSIFSLYKDVQGTIWAGSYLGGVNYFNPYQSRFIHYNYDQNAVKQLYYSYVGDIVQDKDSCLWLTTDGGGVCCVDKKWNIIHQFSAGSGNALPHNNIKSICIDEKNDYLFIGTYMGGLSRYDRRTGKFHNYLETHKGKDAPNEVVFCVKMWKGQLYVSSRSGVFKLSLATDTFERIYPPAFFEKFDIDDDGYLYLTGYDRIVRVSLNNLDEVEYIKTDSCYAKITCAKATKEGLYIGTLGRGVFYYDKKTRKTENYTLEGGQFPDNYCYNIAVTSKGNVLFIHTKGVTCLDPRKVDFATINFMNNFSSGHIINGCGIYTTGEQIYIGDTKGVTTFLESEFNATHSDNSNFFFSELWVNNQCVYPDDGTNILSQMLPYTQKLELEHDQNNLVIHFALPDFSSGLSKGKFKYKLEGFDKDWTIINHTELHYTNLPPGEYVLHLSTANLGKQISPKEITMRISIAAPWYATWWAWTLYFAIIAVCSYYYISSRVAKRILVFSLEKERFEKQQIENVNQEKITFFTNVSHEFRTPLTLIISHIDLLLQSQTFAPYVYNQLLKVRKNTQRLNFLISELLDFRKLDQGQMAFSLKQADLRLFLKEIFLSFVDYAHQRNIAYTFEVKDAPIICQFAPRLMEKVFYNLLSNAFKYTPENGSIVVSGEVVDDKVEISVQDSGIGIPENEISLIFNRFFQGSNNLSQQSNRTGIGLTFAKSIVEKHQGTIMVESAVGKGSKFTVNFPVAIEGSLDDENAQLVEEIPVMESFVPMTDIVPEVEEEMLSKNEMQETKSHTLLLVEDNNELLQVLKELFTPYYKVVCAGNGVEGLGKVYEYNPDLIISDIMMPQMSGTEMCLQLKNNIDLCHIPIILLTALHTIEQSIEGLNRGADDYVTKPFHARLLLARANNLVRSRILIRQQFSKQPISEIDLTCINPLDKELLTRASQIIEKYIDDTDFDIPVFCEELGIGRSTVFTKFKALAGMTPNNFILNYRLKYAANLLKQDPTISIAEVSDRSGFNTSVYFSQCFKRLFGCTPQQYRKK